MQYMPPDGPVTSDVTSISPIAYRRTISSVHMTELSQPGARSRNMAAIRAKNTRPELEIRHALHAAGFRYRLHNKSLPGTPDLVLRKHKTAVFVHGCFWHLHRCKFFRWPKTRAEFWRDKLIMNARRDASALHDLMEAGWRVAVIWECTLRSKSWTADEVVDSFIQWLSTDEKLLVLESKDS